MVIIEMLNHHQENEEKKEEKKKKKKKKGMSISLIALPRLSVFAPSFAFEETRSSSPWSYRFLVQRA